MVKGMGFIQPSTWIIPDNTDNTTVPLCPVGTVARDYWPERGPTYSSVFQTVEGGPGYWAGNKFHYGPPKFKMNSTPNCYSQEKSEGSWVDNNPLNRLSDIAVYPNPASHALNVLLRMAPNASSRLQLTDLQGKIIQTVKLSKMREVLDVSSLSNGIYILNYSDGTHFEKIRFIKID